MRRAALMNMLVTRVVPAALALGFHGLALIGFLWAADRESDEFQFEQPRIISAELIVMEARPQPVPPKPKPAPRQSEASPLPQEPEPTPEPREEEPEPQPAPPEPEPEPKPEPAFDEDRLLGEALDMAIDQERAELAASEEMDAVDQIAMSYHMGIYQQIVANWSRPVSARNGMRTDLIVHLVPTGEVANVTLVRSSGDLAFDRSAEQAVRRAGRFDVPSDQQVFETHFRALAVTFSPQDLLR